jgi:hypothetical protein
MSCSRLLLHVGAQDVADACLTFIPQGYHKPLRRAIFPTPVTQFRKITPLWGTAQISLLRIQQHGYKLQAGIICIFPCEFI